MNLVRSWPQGQAGATPLGWSRPQPLMPPRIEGWPRGVVPSGNAEALLETAVAYWDASKYRPGDRCLRNQGVAGELLDLRLGSSVVANTNDPLYLAPEQSGYVYLPGVNSNSMSVPNEAALRLVDDFELIFDGALDSWSAPLQNTMLMASYTNTDGRRSYVFDIDTSGRPEIRMSVDGTAILVYTGTALAIPAGSRKKIKATRNKSAGEIKFWLSDDGVSWLQHGSTISASTSSLFANTVDNFTVGAFANGVNSVAGRVYRAIVKDGIDGTTVLDIDCDAITSGSATSFTATTGQTVTINRSTSGRKSVAMPSRWNGGRPCFLFGTDDYMEVQDAWQHQLLNFGQADSFTVVAAVRVWATQGGGQLLSKANASGLGHTGFLIQSDVSTYRLPSVDDGTNRTVSNSVNRIVGALQTLVGVRDTRSRRVTSYLDGTAGTAATDTTRDIGNRLIFRIGTNGNPIPGGHWDGEISAAAIFRRALSAQEVQLITSYYTGASA